jgi:hypothetical protein
VRALRNAAEHPDNRFEFIFTREELDALCDAVAACATQQEEKR